MYEGHVERGGPAASREVTLSDGAAVQIRKLSVGGMDNNVYVLRRASRDAGESGADAIVIDAADEPDRILDLVDDCRVGAIVTTHRHADHWQGLAPVAAATGARTYAGADDASSIPHPIDEPVSDGEQIQVGDIILDVVSTPGHTPGSICLLLRAGGGEHHLFTGDTLFPGGPGNTFGDDAAFAQIMQSLRERIFPLPDSTWVYPGHGDDTTLGRERPHLDEWDARGW